VSGGKAISGREGAGGADPGTARLVSIGRGPGLRLSCFMGKKPHFRGTADRAHRGVVPDLRDGGGGNCGRFFGRGERWGMIFLGGAAHAGHPALDLTRGVRIW